jgi:hypothetical protein
VQVAGDAVEEIRQPSRNQILPTGYLSWAIDELVGIYHRISSLVFDRQIL